MTKKEQAEWCNIDLYEPRLFAHVRCPKCGAGEIGMARNGWARFCAICGNRNEVKLIENA